MYKKLCFIQHCVIFIYKLHIIIIRSRAALNKIILNYIDQKTIYNNLLVILTSERRKLRGSYYCLRNSLQIIRYPFCQTLLVNRLK